MTSLYVLGSGSLGNAFAVVADDEVLLIDAGFSAREIGRRAERVGLDLGRAIGLVLTHEHGDHTAGAARLGAHPRDPDPHRARHLGPAAAADAEGALRFRSP